MPSGQSGQSGPAGQTADSGTGQSGSQPRGSMPGGETAGQSGQSGVDLPSYGENGTGNGDLVYGSEDDPFGTIGSNTRGAAGSETADGEGAGGSDDTGGSGAAGSTQARVGELDVRLEESYGEFDGMILGERERAQGMGDDDEQSARTREAYGGGDSGDQTGEGAVAGTGNGEEQGGPIIARNSRSNAGGGYMPDSDNREGEFDGSARGEQYPVPEDIPEGNDDDVVAGQLREAAMSEPDPEVRERLWDEYRRYTGLPVEDTEE